MSAGKPVVTPEEIFAVNGKVRWVGLASNRGDVLLSQMRASVESLSPPEVDREFVALAPLTMIGVCERYSEYLKGVDYVVVWFHLAVCVYARLGSQVLAVSIEKDQQAVVSFLEWLEKKRSEVTTGRREL
jgi:hypothetical protein